MDITKIRQEMIRIAKERHPNALDYRVDTGECYDYVSVLYGNELGEFESSIHDDDPPPAQYIWMTVGIYSDEIEKSLSNAA